MTAAARQRGPARTSLPERFARYVGQPTASGCVEWTGWRLKNGYGHIRRGGKNDGKVLAHRAAWELARGPIPNGLMVCHKCDNRACVNVEHLFLGTQLDNVRDAVEKQRHAWVRTAPPWTRLTDDDLSDILVLRAFGLTQRAIAADYGVSPSLVSILISGKLTRRARASAPI